VGRKTITSTKNTRWWFERSAYLCRKLTQNKGRSSEDEGTRLEKKAMSDKRTRSRGQEDLDKTGRKTAGKLSAPKCRPPGGRAVTQEKVNGKTSSHEQARVFPRESRKTKTTLGKKRTLKVDRVGLQPGRKGRSEKEAKKSSRDQGNRITRIRGTCPTVDRYEFEGSLNKKKEGKREFKSSARK